MKIEIEVPDNLNWVSCFGKTDDPLVEITINHVAYHLPEHVVAMMMFMDNQKQQALKARDQADKAVDIIKTQREESDRKLKEFKQLFGRALAGETIVLENKTVDECVMERISSDLDRDYKLGMWGFIYNNWHRLGEVPCECGGRIDYESSRSANDLICKQCFDSKKQVA